MSCARTAGHLEGGNPVEGVEKGLARQKPRVMHHAAMPWADVPDFLPKLGDSSAALALRFLILTAARTREVIGARCSEIDTEARLWIIPAERMKAEKEHRVPLSDEALAVLEKVRGLDAEFFFQGVRRGKAPPEKRSKGLSNMAMAKALDRAGRVDVTVHGFRSSFRDWAAERGGLPREIAEKCLAHHVGNAVERAYARSDLLEKRRTLMQRWARSCCPVSADVIPIAASDGRRA